MIPYERTAESLSDFLGQPISQGALDNMLSEACGGLEGFVEQMVARLQQEEVACFDETSIRAEGFDVSSAERRQAGIRCF